MLSSFAPWCAETCISASEGESQKPHQGFAGQNPILHRGIEWSKSTFALGLPEWAGKTASGPAVAANNVQQRIQQIANHLKNCGGVYPLTAAVAGTFKVDSSLPSSIYAVTSQSDQLYSQTSINPNTFGNANPSTQTGVVVHEWFHTTQIDDNPFFTFMNGLSQKLPSWLGGGFMENQANAAAKQALQTCGPG